MADPVLLEGRRKRPAELAPVRVARAVAYYLFFNIFPDAHSNDLGQTRRNKAIVHRALARAAHAAGAVELHPGGGPEDRRAELGAECFT